MPTEAEYQLLAATLRSTAETLSTATTEVQALSSDLGVDHSPIEVGLVIACEGAAIDYAGASTECQAAADIADYRARVCQEYTATMARYRARYEQYRSEIHLWYQYQAAGVATGPKPSPPRRPDQPAMWAQQG